MLSEHSGAVDFPRTLRYECDKGYSIDGQVAVSKRKFQAQCKPNGQLDGMMSCQPISCGTPRVLPYTRLAAPWTPRKSVEYGEEVQYECQEGYTIGGHDEFAIDFTSTCQDSGILTDPEVCEPVKCGLAPAVPKSRAAVAGDVFFGMHLEYKCDAGYTLDSTPGGGTQFQRHCLKSGAFSELSLPQPCQPISAGQAPIIEGAHMTEYAGNPVGPEDSLPTVHYPHGLEYRCNPGFSENGSPSGPVKISTRVNTLGKLSPSLPTACLPITFGVRGEVKDSRNGRSLDGVTVQIMGPVAGSPEQTRNGMFSLAGVRSGNVTLEYKKDDFITATKTFNVDGDVVVGGIADVSMSPKMQSDQWRAVLKWGSEPSDLDTYAQWARTKVFYQATRRQANGLDVTLEHDEMSGYGPETLYMTGVGHCTASAEFCDIKYSINDYTKSGRMKDISKAEVILYTGDGVAGSWTIEACKDTVSTDGNWWHVFTLDAKQNKLKWTCNTGSEVAETTTTTAPTTEDGRHVRGPEDGDTWLNRLDVHLAPKHVAAKETSSVPNASSDFKHEQVFKFGESRSNLRPPVLLAGRGGYFLQTAK
jgi:hypothetical protein